MEWRWKDNDKKEIEEISKKLRQSFRYTHTLTDETKLKFRSKILWIHFSSKSVPRINNVIDSIELTRFLWSFFLKWFLVWLLFKATTVTYLDVSLRKLRHSFITSIEYISRNLFRIYWHSSEIIHWLWNEKFAWAARSLQYLIRCSV